MAQLKKCYTYRTMHGRWETQFYCWVAVDINRRPAPSKTLTCCWMKIILVYVQCVLNCIQNISKWSIQCFLLSVTEVTNWLTLAWTSWLKPTRNRTLLTRRVPSLDYGMRTRTVVTNMCAIAHEIMKWNQVCEICEPHCEKVFPLHFGPVLHCGSVCNFS